MLVSSSAGPFARERGASSEQGLRLVLAALVDRDRNDVFLLFIQNIFVIHANTSVKRVSVKNFLYSKIIGVLE